MVAVPYKAPDQMECVELSVPADPYYVRVIRTAIAALAARLRITVDQIEDLRIAIDEICALFISGADEAATLDCAFYLDAHQLRATICGPSHDLPTRADYSWAVLAALVDTLEWHHCDHGIQISLSVAPHGGAGP